MNNELIDRYVYAVLRRLPKSSRGELEPELRGLISDMLDERCGEMTPTETDVKVVLAELGTPSELALKYDPEGERFLIGPKYFRPWLKVLTIVLAAMGGAILLGSVIGIISGEIKGPWVLQFAEITGSLWQGALSAFAIVTAIFAFLEYKKVDIDTSDDLSKLPSVPKKKETISKAECIIGIVICTILPAVLLYAPQSLLFGISIEGGENVSAVSLFREKAFANVWYLLVIGFGAAIALECVKLMIGRYNYRTAIASTVCNTVAAAAMALAFVRTDVVAPEFVESINAALAEEGTVLNAGLANNLVGGAIAGIVIVCSVIDIIVCWVKAYIFSNN